MGANAVWQPVAHRPNLDVRLQYPKSALNIGQALVTLYHLSCCCIGVGQSPGCSIAAWW
jgi:hypothetical protein